MEAFDPYKGIAVRLTNTSKTLPGLQKRVAKRKTRFNTPVKVK